MRATPDWDALVGADLADLQDHGWFPASHFGSVDNLLAMEGMRFRNVYVTSKAIEAGSAGLFQHLYFNARMTGGKVLHVSDYRETE